MHKKFMLACMAIAAFAAFVIVPSASAATLTEPSATPKLVPIGASIKGTATETKFTAGENTVTCSHAEMKGTVTHNNDVNHVETVSGEIPIGGAVFKGTAAGEDCTSTGLGPVKPTVNSRLCLHVPANSDTGTVTGCGGNVTFTLAVTNLGINCHYAISSLNVEITTEINGKDAEVKVDPGQLVPREENFFCPPNGELDMEFVLTTTSGTTLTFS